MLTLSQINNIIDVNVVIKPSFKMFQKLSNKCYIHSFITGFYKCNEIFDKKSSIIIALIYLNKYGQSNTVNSDNIKQLLETCLILSNKYCADYEINDSGIFEIDVLKTLSWNLYVDENEYTYFEKLINSYI